MWLVNSHALKDEARKALRAAEVEKTPPGVAAITAWEVCLSEKLGKTGQSIGGDGKRWFYEAVHTSASPFYPFTITSPSNRADYLSRFTRTLATDLLSQPREFTIFR